MAIRSCARKQWLTIIDLNYDKENQNLGSIFFRDGE